MAPSMCCMRLTVRLFGILLVAVLAMFQLETQDVITFRVLPEQSRVFRQ